MSRPDTPRHGQREPEQAELDLGSGTPPAPLDSPPPSTERELRDEADIPARGTGQQQDQLRSPLPAQDGVLPAAPVRMQPVPRETQLGLGADPHDPEWDMLTPTVSVPEEKARLASPPATPAAVQPAGRETQLGLGDEPEEPEWHEDRSSPGAGGAAVLGEPASPAPAPPGQTPSSPELEIRPYALQSFDIEPADLDAVAVEQSASRPPEPDVQPTEPAAVTTEQSASLPAEQDEDIEASEDLARLAAEAAALLAAESASLAEPAEPWAVRALRRVAKQPRVVGAFAKGLLDVAELKALLSQRVRLSTVKLPLWGFFAGSIAMALVLGGGFASLFSGGDGVAPHAPASVSSASEPAASASEISALAEPSITERAAIGDPAAMQQLEARTAAGRTVEESVALAHGRARQHAAELEKLRDKLRRQPALATDPQTLEELRSFIDDPRTAIEALQIAAGLPGEAGPDFLYDVWTGTLRRSDATRLAEELVYSKSVRARASAALAVVLDLREAEQCEQVLAILTRATEHGDRRSLRVLGKLLTRRGCGPKKADDCYACLRGGNRLADAIQAVKLRPAPKP
jgi:hypothetical protein